MVEPIYNPAIEAQAIARVLRMGQTRAVKILKYVTENTLEPIQERKKRLAKLSLDDRPPGGETIDDLKFVLDTTPTKARR
ncbi:hypothetical protein B0T21DRAFT_35845 [Apiosordaria backusii]|uniref:Uncharacterized protein n=1 Tax=Apiosordaria backusii TaxID=314023 RepID=A0AA40E764_9PEZI|nr:hypothetical protein B0T21DRAFT_35845 [Apiosordaria backusii]